MTDQNSGSDQGPGWQHVDEAFETLEPEAPKPEAEVAPAAGDELNVAEPPKLDQRVAVDTGPASEIPDAFMQQCQSLWRQAMNIAGEAYQRMKSELTHRIEDLTSERDALLAERNTLRSEFEEFRQATSSQVEHLNQYEAQLAEVRAALELERDLHKRHERELTDRDRQLEEALQAVSVNENRAQEAESALEKETGLRQDFEGQLKEATAAASEHADGEGLQGKLNRASSKLEVVTRDRDRLTKDLNEAFETINFSMERSRQLEQELTEARAAVAKQEARVDEVKARVAAMDSEAAVLRKKNEMVNREAQAFAEKNAELLRRFHEAQIPVPHTD